MCPSRSFFRQLITSKVPNVVLTPHIASSTVKTRKAMAQLAADNLVAYLTRGQALTPLNTVPGKAL